MQWVVLFRFRLHGKNFGSKKNAAADQDGDPGAAAPTGDISATAKFTRQARAAIRLTLAEYDNVIRDVFVGQVSPSPQYPGSYGTPSTGFSTEAGINEVGAQDVEQIELAAEDIAQSVAVALPALLPCSQTSPGDGCADTFIDTYVRRAFRGQLAGDERRSARIPDGTDDAIADQANFSDAIATLTDHALQTPEFLYVMEAAAPATRPLTGDEIASRLSFMFWDSIPDDTLLAAADAGALSAPEAVVQQAERLLADDKASATMARFFREWTGTLELTPLLRKIPRPFPT